MFTGIIEEVGTLKEIKKDRKNLILSISVSFLKELKINQSIAHNGVCLTVVDLNSDDYTVCVINETIKKTNIKLFKKGDLINLERCLSFGDRIDGHFVQGHIDCVVKCVNVTDDGGSWMFKFKYLKEYENYLIHKGSITLNGVSLTISNINYSEKNFEIAIIPYTFNHTNFKFLQEGNYVNAEFDIINKQIERLNQGK